VTRTVTLKAAFPVFALVSTKTSSRLSSWTNSASRVGRLLVCRWSTVTSLLGRSYCWSDPWF